MSEAKPSWPNETCSGGQPAHRAAGEQHGERVTERDADDRERCDEIAAGLEADEQHDADEPDADPDEADARHALRVVHP